MAKKIKPDDYYNNGLFEVARFGKVVSMRNNGTEEMNKTYQRSLADEYENIKNEIDEVIKKIVAKVQKSNPENLLNFLVSINFIAMLNKTSEVQYTADENFQLRAVEYIQSVLLAYGNSNISAEVDQSELYAEILNLTIELYKKLQTFYLSWSAKMVLEKKILEDDILKYVMEAQITSTVRGNRYQKFQIPFLNEMLSPHNDIFKELYKTESKNIISGLERLEYSLSSGKVDAIKDVRTMMKRFGDVVDNSLSQDEIDTYVDSIREDNICKIKKLIGLDLYDVKTVTSWNDKLIDSLSYEIGQEKSLFMHEIYNGWPIWNLPVQRKPFIKINGVSYCFDYYNLFDNIYRCIQKSISEQIPEYIPKWSLIQQIASESLVEQLFRKLLPGAKTYRDNYYPKKNSLKECAENDVLVIYKDVLIIIEVKAGSFSYTPAITDYQSHINSFKKLVEKADDQCKRTLNYINSNDEVKIFDIEKNEKVTIRKGNFSQIYSFCVNVDDFNVFTAKAEKIGFINLQQGTIAISIDDLWVYAEYFDSPIQFVHFLEQRKKATTVKALMLNDELDHLGMYIEHNMYSLQLVDYEENCFGHFIGYREDLDNYFASLHSDILRYEKPIQKVPSGFWNIVNKCFNKENTRPFEFTNFLLDFSTDAKEEFIKQIQYILKREKEIKRMFPAITFGDLRYCLYIEQPEIAKEPIENRLDYIYAAMLQNNSDDYYMICLSYDKMDNLRNVVYQHIRREDIPNERLPELQMKAEKDKKTRERSYLVQHHQKKLYPNDPCPCGSGKKYKKCCGKK